MAIYMSVVIFLVVAKLSGVISEVSAARYCEEDNDEMYSYDGSTNDPSQWPRLFPTCNGNAQSPIDIQTSKVLRDAHFKKLRFSGYSNPIRQANVENDGHTVVITPEDNVRRWFTIQGTDFNLVQLHFHWGSQKIPGAEHTVNKRRYEMEADFVHRSPDNRTAVIGVLVQMVNKDNPAFKPIVDVLSNVQFKDQSRSLLSNLYLSRLLPENPASFYGYSGSLTTPMCTEGVAWFVLQRPQTIGRNQLYSFLKVYSVGEDSRSTKCLLAPNYRPLQKRNGRTIFASP